MTHRVLPAGLVTTGLLADLWEQDVVGPAEIHVTDTVARTTGERDPDVLLAIALAVRAPRHGHVCLEMDRLARDGLATDGGAPVEVTLPAPDAWRAKLLASPAVRAPDDASVAPLVLDGGRLYLDRYWLAEASLVDRARALFDEPRDDRDPAAVAAVLDRLFGAAGAHDDRQRAAAQIATRRTLTVLTGGPGTGKTTTVVRLLATLAMTAPAGTSPRIVLAAPTGKAAARMAEAVRDEVEHLDVPAEVAVALRALPARTLHRLLGWRPDAPTRFRHDARNPLPYDVVVVDEASMASLTMVSRLLAALASGTRLVLVGDRDQLTSVDAGAVLSDLCGPRDQPQRAPSIVHLDRFFRFGPDSGIGAVARAIQRVDDDPAEVLGLLRGERTESPAIERYHDVALVPAARGGEPLPPAIRDIVVTGYREAVEAALDGAGPADVLEAYGRLRVLAALRRGPYGVEACNRAIEGWLRRAVPGYAVDGRPPIGRPVLVTRNDYQVELYNGDVGVVVRDPDDPDRAKVAFPTADGEVRLLSMARLPTFEPVFAMSVHKSQGSQFDQTVVVLPTTDSPLLTRELVYTGVTRARSLVTLVADERVLAAALTRSVQRASGVAERLWSRGPAPVVVPGG